MLNDAKESKGENYVDRFIRETKERLPEEYAQAERELALDTFDTPRGCAFLYDGGTGTLCGRPERDSVHRAPSNDEDSNLYHAFVSLKATNATLDPMQHFLRNVSAKRFGGIDERISIAIADELDRLNQELEAANRTTATVISMLNDESRRRFEENNK